MIIILLIFIIFLFHTEHGCSCKGKNNRAHFRNINYDDTCMSDVEEDFLEDVIEDSYNAWEDEYLNTRRFNDDQITPISLLDFLQDSNKKPTRLSKRKRKNSNKNENDVKSKERRLINSLRNVNENDDVVLVPKKIRDKTHMEMKPFTAKILTHCLDPVTLIEEFGDLYQEATCIPRKFVINISSQVRDKFKPRSLMSADEYATFDLDTYLVVEQGPTIDNEKEDVTLTRFVPKYSET